MKLQVNANGSWRNVIEFEASHRDQVLSAAVMLARAAKPATDGMRPARWCVVDDAGKREWLGTLTEAVQDRDGDQ